MANSTAPEVRLPVYDSARRPHPFLSELLELNRYRDLVFQWSQRNIKLRYKRSVLGVLWTLLQPLMLMTILTVVFSTAFRFPVPYYPIYLLPGLLLFDFLSRSTLQIIDEIITSDSLAKRIHLPRSAFAVATVLTYFVNWAIALLPLLAIALFLRGTLDWTVVTVLPGMLLTAMFALGVGLIVATLGAFFTDIHLTYQVLLTGWLYATPIIYPIEVVPEHLQPLFRSNPLLHLCALVRDPVHLGTVASGDAWLIGGAWGLGALILGWWVFTRWRNEIDYRT